MKIYTYFSIIFLFLFSLNSFSQNRISADVVTQKLQNKKVLTVKKTIFYQTDGKCVSHYIEPEDYILITNSFGESKTYMPNTNEVMIINDKAYSSQNELLAVFLSSDRTDLGLSIFGFSVSKQEKDGERIIKTYTSKDKTFEDISKIEMVYEKGLPIYCGYYDKNQVEKRKIYYTKYISLPKFSFPSQITEISLSKDNDTIIKREIYSNIKIDNEVDSYYFDYKIPENAKIVSPFDKKEK